MIESAVSGFLSCLLTVVFIVKVVPAFFRWAVVPLLRELVYIAEERMKLVKAARERHKKTRAAIAARHLPKAS